MANKPRMPKEVKRLVRAKEKRRRALAELPIEEKIRIVVDLQKIANDIRAATGRRKRRVWELHE